VERALTRIRETDSAVQAWVDLVPTPTITGDGPLRGVPVGVKDIIDLAGMPTRCGSVLRTAAKPARNDAVIVEAWRSAGAIPMGKTVTTEFAYFKPGPTRNPANLDHTPGGSSSGSAAAVAAGQVPIAIGSQTAGSVTRPASYCGVASLVMKNGQFPLTGVVGLSSTLDSHGMFAATASDLALAWSALSGEPDLPGKVTAPRIAFWTAEPLSVVTDEMNTALIAAYDSFSDNGAPVHPFPNEALIADVTAAHAVVMAYEASRERVAELTHIDQLSEPLATLLITGSSISEADYGGARRLVAGARRNVDRVLSHYDAIIGPAAPGSAPLGNNLTGDPILSRAWQALGLAAVGVPGLRNASGLPLGFQVVAATEIQALRAAVWAEQHL
jgi:Asp-tRNA(Asn)/Glu-tRNA(Gln) amidotransferase A subunit family amidase